MNMPFLQAAQRARHLALVGMPALEREWRAEWLRRRQAAALASLPAVAASPSDPALEVHMLSGHAQADMGVWASWSVMRFLPEARLCVHSDGTLTDADRARWARVVPGMRFIDRAEADARCAALLLPRFPLLHQWRDVNVMALKLVDSHLLAEAKHVLAMDTDVLCFQPPTAVQHCVAAGDQCMWMQDMHHGYLALPKVLHQVLGAPVPLRVNAGFWVGPRANETDLEMMEWALDRWRTDGRCDWAHVWAEQTMAAVWVGRQPHAQPLPAAYALTSGTTDATQVVRHYVGTRTTRPRFFTEGVRRLQHEIRLSQPRGRRWMGERARRSSIAR